MADIKQVLSAIGTTKSKVNTLPIKNGQLIFVQDAKSIALDFNGKRVFYNQIVSMQTEDERISILAPINDLYYFVIETAVLWTYHGKWIPITTPPNQIVSIVDDTLPLNGAEGTLYINKREQASYIWDGTTSQFIPVGAYYSIATSEDIERLFVGG